ncbi:EAL domain-containing protein [Priestia megaterium]|uniref:EAL domain-containing protein n=1 Tax=Priestia megaterium TaxID=1404 RepID=UPI00237B2563|nr:EAL domain-containing protein [Priestia megaterium]
MDELKKIGVTFALDDFGTGFSSLSHLKDFEFNTLKIDKTFIQHATDKGKQQAITKSILYLAHALNMKVIAEGVETKEQLAFLRLNRFSKRPNLVKHIKRLIDCQIRQQDPAVH